jgi:hypothetical protein
MADNNGANGAVTPLSAAEQKELQSLEMEERRLRVEALRTSVEQERSRRAERERARKAQQDAIDDERRNHDAEQAVCKHKKGGRNLEGFLDGNDNDASIIKNTYPWGEQGAMCTRCLKEWRQPPDSLKKSNPKEYKRLLDEFKAAMSAPTDNTPSGNALFIIAKNPAARARASA